MSNTPRPSLPLARMSTQYLELRNRYYAVTDGSRYYYFPIVSDAGVGPIFRMIKSPAVLLEGYAIIAKKVYHVTLDDLFRRVIRKSREVTLESINGISPAPSSITEPDFDESDDGTYSEDPKSDPATLATILKALHREQQLGTGEAPGVEVDENADATWSKQVEALLSDSDEEEIGLGETWEVEDSSQS